MEWFSRALHCEERLWRVFWMYGLLLLSVFAGIKLFLWGFFSGFMEAFPAYGTWVLIALAEGLIGAWLMLVWGCAAQSGRRLWMYLARLFVLLSIAALFYLIALAAHFPPAVWLWQHWPLLPGREG